MAAMAIIRSPRARLPSVRTGKLGKETAMPHSLSRRQFGGLAAASATLAAAAPALAQQTNEIVKWRLTSSFPKSLDTLFGAAATICQGRRRDDGRQVRDPDLRGRRDRARPAGARRGLQRHRRMRPHLHRLLHRQEPGADLRRLAAVRPDAAPAQCLAAVRRRPQADGRGLRQLRRRGASRPARPAGRCSAGSARS